MALDPSQYRRALLCWAAAASLVPLPVAALAQAKRWRIAVANLDDASAFGQAIVNGLKVAVAKTPEIELTFFDNRNDAALAVENARSVATSKYDLLIEYNGKVASNAPIARIMAEAGIKVLAVQVPVPNAPLFAVDNQASGADSGRVLADEAKRRWPGATPVFVVIGFPEAGPIFLERANAAKEAIGKVYPGAKFEDFSSRGDPAYVRQTVTDLLTRFPDRKVAIWVHLDEVALAAISAVRNSDRGNDVIISTTGGSKAVYAEIKRKGSPLLGTYSFFPELWGDDLLAISGRMLRGESVEARAYPKRQLFLDARNLSQYTG